MSTRIDEGTDTPQTVDQARDAVERSRQRISSTLDALEERIVEKKHEIQDRVDVMRPVREQIAERPFAAIAIGVGVGALLGSLGGGDDDEHTHRRSGRIRGRMLSDDDREELQEWRRSRKRRLRAAMQRQERENGRGSKSGDDDDSRFDALKHQLLGALTSAVTTAVTRRIRTMATQNVGSVMNGLLGGDDGDRSRGGDNARTARSGPVEPAGRTRHAERQSYP
jgi:ElaB/YqjD/DUF883 family membrane-anchored ribosome-binding protein